MKWGKMYTKGKENAYNTLLFHERTGENKKSAVKSISTDTSSIII